MDTLVEYGEDFYEEYDVPEGLSPYAMRTSWVDVTVDSMGGRYVILDTLHTEEVSIILNALRGDC